MNTLGERLNSEDEMLRRLSEKISSDIRVAMPGIIDSYDAATQTATIQPAVQERIVLDGKVQFVKLPLLVDVPVQFPRSGGFAITFPVSKGDECLVVFGDMCMDAWFSNSGVQTQIEKRRHDLSDGFAILGFRSQPYKTQNVSANSLQLRNASGNTCIDIKDGEININAPIVKINGIQYGV